MNLSQQIDKARIDRIHLGWLHRLSYFGHNALVSENTIAYGQMWEVTLHYNGCGKECDGKCVDGAASLVIKRAQDIRRGMPDLHPEVEQIIWKAAFALHKNHSSTGVISPTWGDNPHDTCNCFELAKAQYDRDKDLEKILPFLPKVSIDDMYYEPRFE